MADSVATLYVEVNADDVRRAVKQLADFERQSKRVENQSNKTGKSFNNLAGSMGKLKAAIFGVGIGIFLKEMQQTAVELDGINRAFVAVTGSVEGAGKEFEFLQSQADRLGQNFYNLAGAYKTFLAASKQTRLEGEATRYIFTAIVEASTALGLSSQQTTRSLYAVQQMMSKGKVSAEELRQQLGDQLPGAANYFAQAMGVSLKTFNKLLDDGKVGVEDLVGFAQVLRNRFSKDAEKAVDGPAAAMRKFEEAVTGVKAELLDSGMLEAMTSGLKDFTEILKEEETKRAVKEVGDGITTIVKAGISLTSWYASLPKELTGPASLGLIGGALFGAQAGTILALLAATGVGIEKLQKQAQIDISDGLGWTEEFSLWVHDLENGTNLLEKYRKELTETGPHIVRMAVEPPPEVPEVAPPPPPPFVEPPPEKDYKKQFDQQIKDYLKYQEDKKNATADILDEIDKLTLSSFDYERKQLKKKISEYRKLGVSEIDIARYVAEERKRINDDEYEHTLANSKKAKDGMTRAINKYKDEAEDAAAATEKAFSGAFKGMEDGITEFVKTGKFEFSSFIDSILEDLIRTQISQPIVSGFSSMAGDLFSGLFSANGNAFDQRGVMAFANGGVVNSATPFTYGGGQMGVMGEAGPEAILPLERRGGKLGVSATAANVNVYVQNAPENTKVQRSPNAAGGEDITVIIGEIVDQNLASGRHDNTLQRTFNVNRRGY